MPSPTGRGRLNDRQYLTSPNLWDAGLSDGGTTTILSPHAQAATANEQSSAYLLLEQLRSSNKMTITRHQADTNEEDKLPVRSLLTCRVDSTSTVSTLSFGSGYFAPGEDFSPIMPGRMSSVPRLARIDRFKADGADRGLKQPGRKESIHRLALTATSDHTSSSADIDKCPVRGIGSRQPPKLPSRQDTADRKQILAHSDGDRPGLNRVSGGINVFSRSEADLE
jgi:hypothetical protein